MDYAINPPVTSRVNPRFIATVVVFCGVLAVLIGWPAYTYFREVTSAGIHHRADGVAEVDLKAISTFEFDQNNGKLEDIPAAYRALDGKKVEMVGEMWTKNSSGNELRDFELVYSISKCCTSTPLIQHFVQSKRGNNEPIPYYSGPVRAIGTLKVDVQRDADGIITGIYHLSVDSIQPI